MKGMIQAVKVIATDSMAAAPVGDVTMTLRDYSFTLSRPLTAGRRRIEVRNEAAQDHEIELIRLGPGKTAADLLDWLKDEQGPPPGLPLGGVSPLDSRAVAWFEVDLAAGKYLLLCFVPDEDDGKSHLSHGMIQELEVASALSARE
jgi:hypothetical protein